MNINKDNYEEYFLLFFDNELSGQEKNMVEVFVKQHPDLAEEFLNIKQSVLTPESELVLEDKNALFRHTKKFITYTNYQEIFILYNDNELNSQQRKEAETFLSENPSLQHDFRLLQTAKLQPVNAIVFPDKELLYKRTETGNLVPFKWWKAIAAILIGLGIWTGVDYQKKSGEHFTVENTIAKKPLKAILLPTDTINTKQTNYFTVKNLEKHGVKPGLIIKKNVNKVQVKNNAAIELAVKNIKRINDLPAISNIPDKTGNEISYNISQEVKKDISENLFKENTNVAKNYKEIKEDEISSANKNTVPEALTTSYNDGENNDNNYAFFNISQEKFNKSKVGGFLRKVKRVIERKLSPLGNSKNQREVAAN